MATTPTAVAGTYGIAMTLNGYTIESYSISENPQREQVPDQKNAIVNEVVYDTRWDLRLTIRGAAAPYASSTLSFAGKNWAVDIIEEAGSYNGLLRYNVTAHRYNNFPSDS